MNELTPINSKKDQDDSIELLANRLTTVLGSNRKVVIRETMLYFLYAFSFSWAIYGITILCSRFINNWPFVGTLILVVVGSAGPMFSSFLLKYQREGGISAVRKYCCAGCNCKEIPIWIWFFMFLLPFVSYLLGVLVIYNRKNYWFSDTGYLWPAIFLIMYFGGPVQEEYGWRGYVLDRLQYIFMNTGYTATISSFILGTIWTTWHLPLFLIKKSPQDGINIPGFYFFCISCSFSYTYIHNHSNGNPTVAIIYHMAVNSSSNIFHADNWDKLNLIYSFWQVLVIIIIFCIGGANTFLKCCDSCKYKPYEPKVENTESTEDKQSDGYMHIVVGEEQNNKIN